MLTAKSFVVLAAAAFAVAQVDAAAEATHLKISIHHKQAAPCKAGFREVSVEGVEGIFCAEDDICVADKADGNCPTESAPGMPYGAYCDIVKTGVYGCKPITEDMLEDSEEDSEECGEGESPMSVEGVEGVFCVKGQACVADVKNGSCPEKQEGLPYGSYCDKVKTGVYGCKPSKPSLRVKSHHKQVAPCKPGFREVSVEGVAGVFCAKDQICAGSINGNCPTEAGPGLPYGAYCGTVKTGVLGCKPKTQWMARKSHQKSVKQAAPCKPGFREVSVEGVAGVFCAKDQICAGSINGNCPTESAPGMQYGAYCGTVKTGVLGCKPKTQWMARKSHQKAVKAASKCPAGSTEISVEGVEGVFCAKDQICVADKADGNCPTEAAPGMPYGAYCDIVKTGVYGCKPVTEDMLEDSEEDSEADSEECGEGESPMSVEGVEGVFCVKGQACVADIKDGACPGKQDGLPKGSYCGKVKTGVYGCKAN